MECLRDYGPAHSTWCFSFERYNGVLGATPNNNRSLQVEKTMITRFIQHMVSYKSFPHYMDELQHLLGETMVGSVSDTHASSEMYTELLRYANTTDLRDLIGSNDIVLPVGQMSQHALQSYEVQGLEKMYECIFSDSDVHHCRRVQLPKSTLSVHPGFTG